MAKRNSQLVSQYLENISRKMLEEYQDVIRNFVRKRHGVYALYRRGKLYYVGLASSLLGRLKQHLTNKHGDTWDRFSVYLTIGPAYMKEIESVLIRISDPPGNKQRGKFAKSENLLSKVKAEYRRRKKEEEEDIFGSGKKQKKTPKATKKKVKKAKGRTPVMAQYAGRVKKLRARFKGKLFYARVLKDGRISVGGQRYQSPSAAGAACIQGGCNGWNFWTYERAPGDWVLIHELRK